MKLNPVLLDIPNQYESRRLILRTPLDGDGSITFPAIQETRTSLNQWITTLTVPQSVEEAEESLRAARADLLLRRSIRLLIFRQDSGEFVGEAQFTRFNWDVPRCEIGYWVRKSMQKQGFMTEAIIRMTDIGFDVLNMSRLEMRFGQGNQAGFRVAEKAGYTLEGTLRHHRRRRNGELADTIVYGIIPEEWDDIKSKLAF